MGEGDGAMEVDQGAGVDGLLVDEAAESRAKRWPKVTAAITAVAVLAGGLVVVANRGGPASAEEALARVQAFVAEAKTAAFEGTATSAYGDTGSDVGSSSVDKVRIHGEMRIPGSSRAVSFDGTFASEVLTVPGAVYHREAETEAGLAAEPWVYEPLDAPSTSAGGAAADPVGDAPGDIAFATATGVLSGEGSPIGFVESLGELAGVERVGRDRLRGTMDASALLAAELDRAGIEGEQRELFEEEMAETTGTVEVTVTHDPTGRLDRLEVVIDTTFDGEKATDTIDLRFTRWGEPVDLDAPGADDVDRTPTVDEASLQRFTAGPILAPAPSALPPGWVLDDATGPIAGDPADGDDQDGFVFCNTVDLSYGPAFDGAALPDDEAELPFVTVVLTDEVCAAQQRAEEERPRDVRSARFGAHAVELFSDDEWSYGPGDEVLVASLLVGGVRIEVATNQDEGLLNRLVASLEPFDVAAQPLPEVPLP